MKLLLAIVIGCGLTAAQESEKSKRLESVTWDLVYHQLTWTVAEGSYSREGKFHVEATKEYRIDMDKATMTVDKQTRSFAPEEAAAWHAFLDMIGRYAAGSTVWWETGEGKKAPGHSSPRAGLLPGPSKPVKKKERITELFLMLAALGLAGGVGLAFVFKSAGLLPPYENK